MFTSFFSKDKIKKKTTASQNTQPEVPTAISSKSRILSPISNLQHLCSNAPLL